MLGTAAGGGFPQWNCWCRCCSVARRDPELARPRTQSSVAITHDARRWFLLNASPDVREQLSRLPPSSGTHPEREPSTIGSQREPFGRALRHVPIEAVLLTDAEIDHSLGVVLLREGRCVPLYCTRTVQTILETDSKILSVTRAFADVPWFDLRLDQPVDLLDRDGAPSGLSVEAFAVPAGPPRFASVTAPGHTVGFLIRERESGASCAFVPGCGGLGPEVLERLAAADILLFDGTFWTDTELIDAGIGSSTAREMDHVPIAGDGGSLETLAALPCRYRVYTHINNTNPILLERSPERRSVEAAGLTVGCDGMNIRI